MLKEPDKRPPAEPQDLRGMPADSSRFYEPWPGAHKNIQFAEAVIPVGIKLAAQGRPGKLVWRWNDRDIGKRPGPPAVNPLAAKAQARARELLNGGWRLSKGRLATKISGELTAHHANDEKPPRCSPYTVEGWITSVWQELRPQRARPGRLKTTRPIPKT